MEDCDLAPQPSGKEIIAGYIAVLVLSLAGSALGIAAVERGQDAIHAVEGTVQGIFD